MTTIVFDLHGVLADLVTAMFIYKGVPEERRYTPTDWNDPIMDGVWSALKSSNVIQHVMPPYTGWQYVIPLLPTKYQLMVASNSPVEAGPENRLWLGRHGLGHVPYATSGRRKSSLDLSQGSILVDDRVENVNDWAETVGPAILRRQPWNENRDLYSESTYPIYIMEDWEELPGILEDIELWTKYTTTCSTEVEVQGVHDDLLFPLMQVFATGAIRYPSEDLRYDLISPVALRRLAATYAEGAEKYSPRNWEKGIPTSNLWNHMMVHLEQWRQGATDEDHLGHAFWNLAAIMHFEEVMPSMNDMKEVEND